MGTGAAVSASLAFFAHVDNPNLQFRTDRKQKKRQAEGGKLALLTPAKRRRGATCPA